MSRIPEVATAADLDLASLKIRVVYELGRAELSAGDIAKLAPGAILPLARTVEESIDIVANGKRIGTGTLVQIGDSLGVRVTRLNQDA
jgi:type III secretion protein Q